MFKQHLSGVTGVDTYLIISLMIFLLFFVGVVVRLFLFSKKEIDYLSNIPLENAPKQKGSALLFFLFGSNILGAIEIKTTEDFMMLGLVVGLMLVVAALVAVVWGLMGLTQSLAEQRNEAPAFNFDKLWAKITSLKPLSQEKELLLNEDYDGIKELDNPVPNWFNALFYGTIAFGLVYLLVYHVWLSAPMQAKEYEIELATAQEKQMERLKNAPVEDINEKNVQLVADASTISSGKATYVQYCAACHGQAGEGLVGPNLADEYSLHGGSINEVFKTIKYGVPEKGMVAWGTQLNPRQVSNVANYIMSIQGSNPPNGKAPQGERLASK
jgi:cytochrome c oxidase cbb3-type subunit III